MLRADNLAGADFYDRVCTNEGEVSHEKKLVDRTNGFRLDTFPSLDQPSHLALAVHESLC